MKPEPLKNKLFDIEISKSGQRPQELILKKESDGKFTKTESIKSAVKWLKKEIDCLIGQVGAQTDDEEGYGFPYVDIKERIDEAFEDVKSS